MLFCQQIFPQWQMQNSGVKVALTDICFVDSLYGWAVGDSGTIIHSTDGGVSWTQQFDQTDTIEFKKVQFFDQQRGFVSGNSVRKLPGYQRRPIFTLRTTTGGSTWERMELPSGINDLYGNMEFIDSLNGWIGVNHLTIPRTGNIYRTDDGGKSWQTLYEGEDLIGAISFSDQFHGISFWSGFYDNFDDTKVLITDDGGKTWIPNGTISTDQIVYTKTISQDSIWALGFALSTSVNRGKNWVKRNFVKPTFEEYSWIKPYAVQTFTAKRAWIAGVLIPPTGSSQGILFGTNNMGDSLSVIYQLPGCAFLGIANVGNVSWICATRGIIVKNRNSMLGIEKQRLSIPATSSLDQNYPNPFNPSTQINYAVQHASLVMIIVYDLLGRETTRLVDELKNSGKYSVTWNALNTSAGIYFVRMTANNFTATRKLVLLK